MPTTDTYAADQIRKQLARGPHDGENFYRLQVTGDGRTNWINITPDHLTKLEQVLAGNPGPTFTPEELGTLLAAIVHGSAMLDGSSLTLLESAEQKLRAMYGLPTGPA